MEAIEYYVEVEVATIVKKRYRVVLSGSSSIDVIRQAHQLPVEQLKAGEPVSKYDHSQQTINVTGTQRK